MCDENDAPQKAGLDSAKEVLTYSLALATGTLVFSAGLVAETIQFSTGSRIALVIAWLTLGLSIAAGTLSYSRIPIMIAEKNYDLHDRYFSIPGRFHQILFMLGAIGLGIALSLALWADAGVAAGAGD